MQNFGTIIDNFDAVTKQYVDDKASAKRIKGIKVDNATLADTANKVKNAFTYKAHDKTAGTVLPITYDGSRAASLDFSANDFAYDYNSFNDIKIKLVDKDYATKTYVDNQDALKLDKSGGSITGNLTVGGNLTVNGTTTTVDSTTLQVKDKLIEVAHGNTTTLTTPAGLVAPKYDGTNSGALVFDSTGTAYVGDVTLKDGNIDVANSGLQPLATRTGLVGGNLVQYDSSALTLKDSGKKISDLATTSQVNAKYTKPSGGIPKTDLASDVQTSLGKADSALQAKDISGKANLAGGNTFSGVQTINAPTNVSGSEQTTMKVKTSNGGAIIFGKEGANSGTMMRLDQSDGTCRLRFRSSKTAGAMVWEQPEQGAKLHVDLGKDGSDKHRVTFPSRAGTLALTSQLPTVNNGTLTIQKNGETVGTFTANQKDGTTANITVPTKVSQLQNDSGYTTNKGTVTSVAIKMNGSEKGKVTSSGTIDLGTVLTAIPKLRWVVPTSVSEILNAIMWQVTGEFTNTPQYYVSGSGVSSEAAVSVTDTSDQYMAACSLFIASDGTLTLSGIMQNNSDLNKTKSIDLSKWKILKLG